MINPGFPFIAAPLYQFEKFKQDILSVWTNGVKCNADFDYCTFYTHCDEVAKMLPDLVFTLGPDVHQLYYNIPASSFLFPNQDTKTKEDICQLGVIGQRFSDVDYWVLGDSFLQNYYVAFDASKDKPYIGITLDIGSGAGIDHEIENIWAARDIAIAFIVLGVLVCCITCGCFWH